MHIGSAQVGIVMMMPMLVMMLIRLIIMMMMMLMMIVIGREQPRADEIDRKTANGEPGRLREVDGYWRVKALGGLVADQHGDQCKQQRA